jgi:hypothetical protein
VNHEQLKALGYVEVRPDEWVRHPAGRPKIGREIPHPKPQPDQTPALERANAGEASGLQRIVVRFVGHRVRPIDPDNFAGSVKDLLDGLRHAGLIPGDEPWRIKLETEQEQVEHFADEKTVIEITIPITKG